MKKIDYLDLNGRILKTFAIVYRTNSISQAAEELGVTQTTVSHSLSKLRKIVDDPLFSRAGRGIQPTPKAHELSGRVEHMLDNLKQLTDERNFNPELESRHFIVSANDYQLGLIFPKLLNKWHSQNIKSSFYFRFVQVPYVDMLRHSECDLLITPTPVDAADLYQVSLFEDKIVFAYDKNQTKDTDEYMNASYVNTSWVDIGRCLPGYNDNDEKDKIVIVPSFASVVQFIKGSTRLGLVGSKSPYLKSENIAVCKHLEYNWPFKMYMQWHKSKHKDVVNKWLREQIKTTVNELN